MSRGRPGRGGPATGNDRSRLSIADGMIAVAAVAVGLVLVRQTLPINEVSPAWAGLAMNGSVLAADLLAPISFALLAIRLRPPRPPLRRLARQPGFAACLAAVTAGGLLAIVVGFALAVSGRTSTWRSCGSSRAIASASPCSAPGRHSRRPADGGARPPAGPSVRAGSSDGPGCRSWGPFGW